MKQKPRVLGDDLDDQYLKGEPDYFSEFVAVLIVIGILIYAFW